MTRVSDPTDELERECLGNGARLVAGVDEVGRGAWAGPVSVGVAVVDVASLDRLPAGVRDSKMLSPKRREELFGPIAGAVTAFAIGHASHVECDRLGMTAAQRLASVRAFSALNVRPDVVILDGTVNFLDRERVIARPGADRTVRIVAAASILAKVTRDRMMADLGPAFPAYAFERNRGYPSPAHVEALERFGLTEVHRRSWSFAERYAG